MGFVSYNPLTEVVYTNIEDIEVTCKVESVSDESLTISINTYNPKVIEEDFNYTELRDLSIEAFRSKSKQDIPEDCKVIIGAPIEFNENLQTCLVTFSIKKED